MIFVRSNRRRAFFHDYRAPAIYHLTLTKSADAPVFGSVTGDCTIPPGQPGCAAFAPDRLGALIRNEIWNWPKRHPGLQVYQYAVMPDHVHILVRVTERLPEHLGTYVGKLTGGITAAWRAREGCGVHIFEPGYNDRIIGASRDLDAIYRYIRENPHRLAVRHKFPDYFRRVNDLVIGGKHYHAYGNMFLLGNPFKEAVAVHRSDDERKRVADRERWIYTAANGGVLVSPFISAAEKAVRAEAEEAGGRVILLRREPMGERDKPSGRNFDLCCEGRLLIIAPAEALSPSRSLSRADCRALNTLAQEICSLSFMH